LDQATAGRCFDWKLKQDVSAGRDTFAGHLRKAFKSHWIANVQEQAPVSKLFFWLANVAFPTWTPVMRHAVKLMFSPKTAHRMLCKLQRSNVRTSFKMLSSLSTCSTHSQWLGDEVLHILPSA
jgi:hypothetical protein